MRLIIVALGCDFLDSEVKAALSPIALWAAVVCGGATAITDYQAAMASSYPAAFNNVAIMFANGEGVEKNSDKAEDLYVQVLNRTIHCCAVPVVRYLLDEEAKHNPTDVRRVARALLTWSAALGNNDARRALDGLVADGTLAATAIPAGAKFTELPPWFPD